MIKVYLLVGCWEECEGGIAKVYSGKIHQTKEGVRKEFDQALKDGHCFDSFRIIEENREDIDAESFLEILSGLHVSNLKDGFSHFLNSLALLYHDASERDFMMYEKTGEECYKGTSKTMHDNMSYIHNELKKWGFYDDVSTV